MIDEGVQKKLKKDKKKADKKAKKESEPAPRELSNEHFEQMIRRREIENKLIGKPDDSAEFRKKILAKGARK